MPEGKKKDSFTFSDKIKNSKPAGSKSFANRIFSKIGKDGKPRQTLYERTRRDAPFFIAAVIALLLLPFLYKYSGSVSDDNEVMPIQGDLTQDPDSRDGYYSFVEPGGSTLAPYPGNDTALLLVKPYAGQDSEAITEEQVPEVYTPSSSERDGYTDVAAQKKSSKLRDKETNILNEYRKRAAATTRKAFKRNPTKINTLGGAGLRRPSGSKLGVNMWGGGLKNAASRVKPNTPGEGPKPVSLQPLTAAGKPSRASFGQGHLAAAQKSKDAMSKGNPMEALRDAQMRALDNHRVGGLDFDRNPYGHGGAGQVVYNMNSKGATPWWWDMMQQRMQTQWQRLFDYKWGWIDWGTNLVRTWLGGLLNCLVMGNSDGDPDTFLGSGGNAKGKESKCCGLNEDDFKIKYSKEYESAGKNFKTACHAIKSGDEGSQKCPSGWVAGRGDSATRLSGWRTRANCFGANFKGKLEANVEFDYESSCSLFDKSNGTVWYLNAVGEALDWNKYIYVLAENRLPKIVAGNIKGAQYLCGEKDSKFKNGPVTSGVGSSNAKGNSSNISNKNTVTGNNSRMEQGTSVDKCVIDVQGYGAKSVASFNFNFMKQRQLELFTELFSQKGKVHEGCSKEKPICSKCKTDDKGNVTCSCSDGKDCKSVEDAAEQAFGELALTRVEGMVAKDKLAAGTHTLDKDALPMPYLLFREAYIARSGMSSSPYDKKNTFGREIAEGAAWRIGRGFKSRLNFDGGNARTEGDNRFWGASDNNTGFGAYGCNWKDRVSISCGTNTKTTASADLSYVHFTRTQGDLGEITVTASLTPDNSETPLPQGLTSKAFGANFGGNNRAEFVVGSNQATIDFMEWQINNADAKTGEEPVEFKGTITWRVMKDNVELDSAICSYNSEAIVVAKGGSKPTYSNSTVEENLCRFSNGEQPLVNSAWAAQYANKVVAAYNDYLEQNATALSKKFGFASEGDFLEGNGLSWCSSENANEPMCQGRYNYVNSMSITAGSGDKKGFYPFGTGEHFDEHVRSHYLPTLSEFVYALRLVKGEKIKLGSDNNHDFGDTFSQFRGVPKNAVCAAISTIIEKSEDKSIKSSMPIDDDTLRINPFGAFLQYVGDAAVLFPSQMIQPATGGGSAVKDVRFDRYAQTSAHGPKSYYWMNYMCKEEQDQGACTLYDGYFTQPQNPYPLREMALNESGVNAPQFADFSAWNVRLSNRGKKRTNFQKAYSPIISQRSDYKGEDHLGDMCYKGNGQWVYGVNDTIDVDKVWAYLGEVCTPDGNGLKFSKPWGDPNRPPRGAQNSRSGTNGQGGSGVSGQGSGGTRSQGANPTPIRTTEVQVN